MQATRSAKYTVSGKKDEKDYGILRIDYEISKQEEEGEGGRPAIISRGNLYRIKK